MTDWQNNLPPGTLPQDVSDRERQYDWWDEDNWRPESERLPCRSCGMVLDERRLSEDGYCRSCMDDDAWWNDFFKEKL